MTTTLLLGGPGAGKTTKLLEVVDGALQSGVRASEIALVTFTKAAAREARERAYAKFNLTENDLPWFRTLHSLAFRALGWQSEWIFGKDHRDDLEEVTGEEFNGVVDDSTPVDVSGSRCAGQLLFLDQLARTTRRSLEDTYHDHGLELDWRRAERFSAAYARLREDLLLYDFTDLLEKFLEGGHALPVRLAIVDEAQDLTPLQWAVVDRVFANVPEVWVAGDDDQAVHRWAGALPARLFDGAYDRVVTLPASHRLPRAVFDLANEVLGRISRRYDKPHGAADRRGEVDWLREPDEAALEVGGTWLALGRTQRQLRELVKLARARGVPYLLRGEPGVDPDLVRAIRAYETLRHRDAALSAADAELVLAAVGAGTSLNPDRTYRRVDLETAHGATFNELWHDAFVNVEVEEREFMLACLRRGESLTEPPRLKIETIHGAKGQEAEHVLLLTDTTARVTRGLELDPDSEHRVFYTGVTRAKEHLCVVEPRGPHGYQI